MMFGEWGFIEFYWTSSRKSQQWLIDNGLVGLAIKALGRPLSPPDDIRSYHLRIGRLQFKLRQGRLSLHIWK